MKKIKLFTLLFMSTILFVNCSNDDDTMEEVIVEGPTATTNTKSYNLSSVSDPSISGIVTVTELSDNSIQLDLDLQNTANTGVYPAHVHFNTAAEGGDIAVSLEAIDGNSGKSSTIFTALDNGTAISYADFLNFDGYVNVHLSPNDLGTLVAQGDIGQNELTGDTKSYELGSVAFEDINGDVTFSKRKNGEALAVVTLNNTTAEAMYPGHIHMNTAAEGGDIAVTLSPVNGDTGVGKTNIAAFDDGSAFNYDAILNYDGYVNIHLSADQLGTLVAQGDIGQNELTGETKTYELGSVAFEDISGDVTFSKRKNGEALSTVTLDNTTAGAMYPGHIHMNTAAEGGDIAVTLSPVNGDTGVGKTNIAAFDDGSAFNYEAILNYNGYVNIHLSADQLGTLVAQGDIGQNELTGEKMSYDLATVDVPGVSGTAEFAERINGTTLITLNLTGTQDGGEHPAHIHANDIATGGDIIVSLNAVNGGSGMSKTQVAALNDDTPITYDELLVINGYINVHLSTAELGVLIAQGNIGSNAGEDGNANKTTFNVTNSGSTAYIFNGGSFSDANNPELTLKRGQTYEFVVNASGHPFFIKTVQGNTNGNTYNSGVGNNGAEQGTVTFTVPANAPDTLYYNCQFHSSMTAKINIVD